MTVSPLAGIVHDAPVRHARPADPWGLCVHQCGRPIVRRALDAGADPVSFVVEYYRGRGRYGPAYVIGWSGIIVCIAPEEEWTWHVGLSRSDRELYISGRWARLVSTATYTLWRRRWMAMRDPLDLLPSRRSSANAAFVGVELVPLVRGAARDGRPYRPHTPGSWYTTMQLEAVRSLAMDIARRWRWPPSWRLARVVGHEDLTPHSRSDAGGGWDPGALRETPRLDWAWVLR